MKKLTLKIKGMHCRSCEMLIADSLEGMRAIETVKISYEKGIAEITYDEKKTDEDKLREIIEKEGYKVE